ncbi:MAG: peptidoglycan binding domain-containing protein, partial [Bifidobacteriaceae bacterium]|nr:peptidoglycan binding domain-containing protein [Bifidobacteriaceae bacterium]
MKLSLRFQTRKSRFNNSKLSLYILVCAAIIVIIGTSYYSLNKHFSDKALPGTYILGADVSGMDYEQIVDAIDSQTGKIDLKFLNSSSDAKAQLNINDLKLIYDAPTTAVNALGENQNANPLIRFLPVWHKNMLPNYLLNGDKLNDILMDKLAHGKKKFENANLVYNSDINDVQIVGGTPGLAIDESQTLADISANLCQGNLNAQIYVSISEHDPKIKYDQAKKALD